MGWQLRRGHQTPLPRPSQHPGHQEVLRLASSQGQALMSPAKAPDAKAQALLASRYAKEMRNPKLALSRPEEWNYLEVTELELSDAIRYEARRKNPAFRQKACLWLDSKFKGGLTVREFILLKPEEEFDALWNPCPIGGAGKMLISFPLFPLPWLAYEPEDRAAVARWT